MNECLTATDLLINPVKDIQWERERDAFIPSFSLFWASEHKPAFLHLICGLWASDWLWIWMYERMFHSFIYISPSCAFLSVWAHGERQTGLSSTRVCAQSSEEDQLIVCPLSPALHFSSSLSDSCSVSLSVWESGSESLRSLISLALYGAKTLLMALMYKLNANNFLQESRSRSVVVDIKEQLSNQTLP